MTPSKYIKAQGLPNLQYVADKVGKHRDTLHNWYHANFALFEVVVAGVRVKDIVSDSEESFEDWHARMMKRNNEWDEALYGKREKIE